MSPIRLTYQNWIVALGCDPDLRRYLGLRPDIPLSEADEKANDELRRAVGRALESLGEQERFFIIRFYFMGESYAQLSLLSGRADYRLAAIHRRALRKLRTRLAEFVHKRYQIETESTDDCIICRSSFREQIDTVISNRDRSRSWKPVITELKERFSIVIKTPQILIGHEKYH